MQKPQRFLCAITYHRAICRQCSGYVTLELDYSVCQQSISPYILASNGIIYPEQNFVRWI